MFAKIQERLSGAVQRLNGRTDLLEGICAMAALVAAADGRIDDAEVEATIHKLRTHATLARAFTSSQIEAEIDRQLGRASLGRAGKLALKREIEEARQKSSAEDLEMALMIAIDIADCDGSISSSEREVLDDIARQFGLSMASYL